MALQYKIKYFCWYKKKLKILYKWALLRECPNKPALVLFPLFGLELLLPRCLIAESRIIENCTLIF
ncbi:hypothetical protein AHMF7616_03054 [Adhaeribacter pallidiroseus]|uniref:Uncharacterized protein n=1 Tax=Adhaeribacter pallidiroseus TaxID=2072847 RepID=A0A369QJF8_9BACT|nr:hypothetical protein AHMF7616_03054 [Adhaeribacter pallidiroseus]